MAKRMDNGNGRPTHEEIARRAKAIYEANGQLAGHDLDNWLAAEAELLNARKPVVEARPLFKELTKAPALSNSNYARKTNT